MNRVLGVLAGGDMPLDMLGAWAESAHHILAADAGADRLFEIGIVPHEIIGDLDSLKTQSLGANAIHDPCQETTDCDKLLAHASKICDTISLIGIEGDLLDHTLAALHSAAKAPLNVRLALRTGMGWILTEGDHILISTSVGRRISVIPIADSTGVTLTGVEWPLSEAKLSPLAASGISNRSISNEVETSLASGAVFVFVECPRAEVPNWELGIWTRRELEDF